MSFATDDGSFDWWSSGMALEVGWLGNLIQEIIPWILIILLQVCLVAGGRFWLWDRNMFLLHSCPPACSRELHATCLLCIWACRLFLVNKQLFFYNTLCYLSILKRDISMIQAITSNIVAVGQCNFLVVPFCNLPLSWYGIKLTDIYKMTKICYFKA